MKTDKTGLIWFLWFIKNQLITIKKYLILKKIENKKIE
jgi:hypothetical protein